MPDRWHPMPAPNPTMKAFELGYQQGLDAANGRPVRGIDGKLIEVGDAEDMCPYPADSSDAFMWREGYRAAWDDEEKA